MDFLIDEKKLSLYFFTGFFSYVNDATVFLSNGITVVGFLLDFYRLPRVSVNAYELFSMIESYLRICAGNRCIENVF